jgi:hypothetical protein
MATIAARRLRASRLTGRRFRSAEETVAWHLAMQAQDWGPTTWSIGERTSRIRADAVDAALTRGTLVRTHVLRETWHVIDREDIRWLLRLSGPRVQQKLAPRYRQLGLDARTRSRAERAVARALEGGVRMTRDQLAAVLDRAGIDREGQRLPHLLAHCELEGLIASGGLVGKRQTFARLDERAPEGPSYDRDEALVEVVRRSLRSHGPAAAQDLSWWSGFTVSDIRAALRSLDTEIRREEVDGLTLWSLVAEERAAAPRGILLLPPYDEILVGHTVSRFAGDPRRETARAAWGDRSLPSGIVLLDGVVAGYWSRRVAGAAIDLGVLLERPRPRTVTAALEEVAARHERFFGRTVRLAVSAR